MKCVQRAPEPNDEDDGGDDLRQSGETSPTRVQTKERIIPRDLVALLRLYVFCVCVCEEKKKKSACN